MDGLERVKLIVVWALNGFGYVEDKVNEEIADKIIFSSMKKGDKNIKKDGKGKKNMERFSWEKIVKNWIELLD